jgi:hypothetical protein
LQRLRHGCDDAKIGHLGFLLPLKNQCRFVGVNSRANVIPVAAEATALAISTSYADTYQCFREIGGHFCPWMMGCLSSFERSLKTYL